MPMLTLALAETRTILHAHPTLKPYRLNSEVRVTMTSCILADATADARNVINRQA